MSGRELDQEMVSIELQTVLYSGLSCFFSGKQRPELLHVFNLDYPPGYVVIFRIPKRSHRRNTGKQPFVPVSGYPLLPGIRPALSILNLMKK